MEEVSQNGRRKPRSWTDDDQHQAEKLRAEGLSYTEIGLAIGRHLSVVHRRLNPQLQDLERSREYQGKWRNANREALRAGERRRYWKNRDHFLEKMRRRRDANPESHREYSRQWRKDNPEMHCEQSRRRRALSRSASQRAIIPLTLGQVRERFALFGDRCAYCGFAERLTVDHVLPLTAGGLDEVDNIAPACVSCNSGKKDRQVEVWYCRQPFFTETRWRKIRRHCPDATAGQASLALQPPSTPAE